MLKTLSVGSFGTEVKELQSLLNLLPTFLPRLVVDGVFGFKTRGRTVEFQRQSFLAADGVVGALTWGQLLNLVFQILPAIVPSSSKRDEVVALARAEAEAGGVHAKRSGGPDPAGKSKKSVRMGHEQLLKYFRVSAPHPAKPGTTVVDEPSIKFLMVPGSIAPMPHWCGIFALWALKTANLPVGNWIVGKGISSVSGITQVLPKVRAQKGDVGFVNNGFEHHFIIEEVFLQDKVPFVHTIEGNSGKDSEFTFGTRSMSSLHSVYTPF